MDDEEDTNQDRPREDRTEEKMGSLKCNDSTNKLTVDPHVSGEVQQSAAVDLSNAPERPPSRLWRTVERGRSSKKSVIAVVSLALFTDMALYDCIVPILPSLLQRVGRDESAVGVLFAIYAVGFLVATPVFGIWSDRRRDRKLPMILGQAGLAVATLLFAFSHSFWLLIVARLLQGIAAAVSWTLGMALLADAVPSVELGQAMGTVFGFQTLGYFVGPLMGGVLTQLFSIEMPFIICSVLCMIDLVARALIKPKPPPDPNSDQQANGVTIPKLLGYPEVLLVGLVVILTSASFSAVETLLSAHLQKIYHLDVMGVSFAMMAIIIPSVIFSFLAGYLADRMSRYALILASICLYLFATPLLGIAGPLWVFLLGSVYFGATSSLLQAPALPEMAAIVGRLGGGSYAQVYAILNMCYSTGMLVGPLLASHLNHQIRFFLTMCVFSVPFLFMVPPFIWLAVKSHRNHLKSQLDRLENYQITNNAV